LNRLPEFYGDLTRGLDEAVALVDRAKWAERVDQLIKQDWDGDDRTPLVDHLLSMSWQVLDELKPDLLLSWNTLCPHTGVAHDMARAMGIPSLLIEKAVFPDTWFIEEGGLLGLSVLAGKSLESLAPPESHGHYRDVGRAYLERTSFATYNRYAQVQESPEMERLLVEPYAGMRPRVSFFPPDDGTLGFVPVDGEDRKRIIPGYDDSFDAAMATARAHDGLTIFKPHPSFSERTFPEEAAPGLHIIDYDFRKVMEWSDVVGTTGSGLEFVAMAMDKPVLLLANDILAGKGIAYEAQDPAELPEAVAAAYGREDWDARKERFYTYCGYLVSEYLVSPSDASEECRRPNDVVESLCHTYLEGKETGPAWDDFYAARERLLNTKWAKKVTADTEESLAIRKGEEAKPKEDSGELLAGLRTGQWPVVVLDFDHTLYRENSTERFLDVARPKILAFLLVVLADAVVDNAARWGLCNPARWRDYMRVVCVTAGMPWSWLWWRMTARGRMEREVNGALSEAVAESKPKRVVILSLGMEHVIKPMAKALPYAAEVIACRAGLRPQNLRKHGKVRALKAALSEDEIAQSVYVTDSPEDLEVCGEIRPSYLVQWTPYPEKAFHDFYMPFRYVLQGKYPNRRYFRNQLVKEEYLLLLLAYAFSPVNCIVLALLYASMYCVYELGYWYNDHRASRKEKKPTLSKGAAKFKTYPIQRAWIWAIGFGAAGIMVAHWADTPLRGDEPTFHSVLWGAVLFGLYASFAIFNRLDPYRRLYMFPWLHSFKVFACAALVPVTALGILLLTAQATSQIGVYLIYRHRGEVKRYNRQTFRAIFFVVFTIAALAFAPERYSLFFSVQAVLILLWLAWRIVERVFNKPLGTLVFRAAQDPRRIVALFRRIRRGLAASLRGGAAQA
jgi:phosphoserine phosphatase